MTGLGLRRATRLRGGAGAAARALGLCLTSTLAVVAVAGVFLGDMGLGADAASLSRALVMATLAQTVILVLAAVLLPLTGSRGGRRMCAPVPRRGRLFAELPRPAVLLAVLFAATSLPGAAIATRLDGGATMFWRAGWAVGLVACASLALGSVCGALLPRSTSAAAVGCTIVLAATLAPVLAGPVIRHQAGAGRLMTGTLAVSPLVTVARALDFDLMRSEWVYRLSPIGPRGFEYPRRGAMVLGQLLFSAACFAIAARGAEGGLR